MIRKSYDPGQSKDVLALGDLLGVDITTSLIGELDGNELKQPKIDAALHEELPLRDRESAQCSNNVEQVQMATALAALGWPLVPEQPPLLLPMSEDDSPQIIANNSQTIKALELALHSQHRDAPMPKWDTAWNAENLHMLCSALKPTDIHQNVSHHAKSKTLSKRSHTFVDASTDVDLTGLKFVDETAPTNGRLLGPKKKRKKPPEQMVHTDGNSWRKYGQKVISSGLQNGKQPMQRNYYRCSQLDCNAKKSIQWTHGSDRSDLVCIFTGVHNHIFKQNVTENIHVQNGAGSEAVSAKPE